MGKYPIYTRRVWDGSGTGFYNRVRVWEYLDPSQTRPIAIPTCQGSSPDLTRFYRLLAVVPFGVRGVGFYPGNPSIGGSLGASSVRTRGRLRLPLANGGRVRSTRRYLVGRSKKNICTSLFKI